MELYVHIGLQTFSIVSWEDNLILLYGLFYLLMSLILLL